jgi:hypothetical protein
MSEQLERALRGLAEETHGAEAPARVKSELRKELRRRRAPVVMKHWLQGAAAAVVLVAAGFGLGKFWGTEKAQSAPEQTVVESPQVAGSSPLMETPVIEPEPAATTPVRRAVQRPERWSDTRDEAKALTPWFAYTVAPGQLRGQVIRVEVSAQTAAQFGVVAQGPVSAQVFMTDDGVTRAIRFLK